MVNGKEVEISVFYLIFIIVLVVWLLVNFIEKIVRVFFLGNVF